MAQQFESKYRVKGDELTDDFFNSRFRDIDLRVADLETRIGGFDEAVDALIARGLDQINTQLQASIAALQVDVAAAVEQVEIVAALMTALEAAVDAIVAGSLPASGITVSTIAGLTATHVQAALAEHQADIDAILASKGANSGIATLDADGLVPASQLPAIAITDVFEAANQSAMLALTAQRGDIAIRSDLNKCFALSTNSPSTLADWKELKTPTDVVLSVAGLTGAISSGALKTALALAISDVSGLQTALDGKEAADADILKKDVSATLAVGYKAASYDNGTKSSGTFTPDLANRNLQHYTNNGAHTLAPPADGPSLVLDQINGASAGAVTRSGFTQVDGDTLTTTNGHKFRHFITVGNGGSHCYTKKMA